MSTRGIVLVGGIVLGGDRIGAKVPVMDVDPPNPTGPDDSGPDSRPLRDVVTELKTLCRGRGLLAPDLEARVGPLLARFAALDDVPERPARRAALATWLASRADALPDDLRLVARVALGLDPRARRRLLGERLGWLASDVGRDQRTIRRRADEALRLLAELVLAQALPPSKAAEPVGAASEEGWYTENLEILVRLDGPDPEVLMERRIVAVEDTVESVTLAVSLPKAPKACSDRPAGRDLSADILFGGLLQRTERTSESHFRFVVLLPRRLHSRERHNLGLRLGIPPGQRMAPHFAFVPFARCDELVLRIRFPVAGPPSRVWLLQAVPPRTVDDEPKGLPEFEVDRAGEVQARFTRLSLGLGYGFRW
jgi:hypothetical protein